MAAVCICDFFVKFYFVVDVFLILNDNNNNNTGPLERGARKRFYFPTEKEKKNSIYIQCTHVPRARVSTLNTNNSEQKRKKKKRERNLHTNTVNSPF